MDVNDHLPDNKYMQDPSTDNIVSEYTNQIQQSRVIPDSLSKTPLLVRNHILLDIDELAYTQYFDISNDITVPINNNNVYRVPVAKKTIQDVISPLIRSLDKVSSTKPKSKRCNLDTLQKTISYQNMLKVIKHHKLVSQNNIQINNLGQDPMKDMDNFSTMQKRYHDTISIKPTEAVWHYDIAYGVGTVIGSIRYGLLLTGRYNRYTYEFSLSSLKDECVLKAMQTFDGILGHRPKRMIADNDFKLIGGEVADYFELDPDRSYPIFM